MDIDITAGERKTVLSLLHTYLPGTTVWAFGSRVKFTSRAESDLDLVAFIKPEQENQLTDLIDAYAESDLPFKVDILDWNAIPDNFKLNIRKEYVVLQDAEKLDVPKNWKTCKLEEIAKVQTGPFGSQLHQKDYTTFGTPIITVEHLGDNKILHNNLPRISDEDKTRLSKYQLKAGDIVFSRVGSVDRRAYVKPSEDGWLFSGRCLRVRTTSKKINPKYLSYFFGTEDFKTKIRSIAVGATMPSLNTSIMNNIDVVIPEKIDDQVQVAAILSALDDKIELNLQMNQTLEAIAQTLFKEWFVNFDFPGFDGELINGLPIGWKKGKLGEAIDLIYGKALKADTRTNGDFPVVGSNGIVDYHNKYLVKGPGIVIGRKGTIGEVTWIDQDFFPIDTTFFIKDILDVKGLFFHYYLLLNQDFKKIGSDSAVPGLNRNQALSNKIILPSKEIIIKFNSLISPFFDKKLLLQKEIQTLTQIRDNLLPKLMTGKIRVN